MFNSFWRITNYKCICLTSVYTFVLSILCECVVVSNVGVGRNSKILTKCIQIKQNAKECKAITTFNVNSIWVSHKWFPFAKMVSTLKSNLTLPSIFDTVIDCMKIKYFNTWIVQSSLND